MEKLRTPIIKVRFSELERDSSGNGKSERKKSEFVISEKEDEPEIIEILPKDKYISENPSLKSVNHSSHSSDSSSNKADPNISIKAGNSLIKREASAVKFSSHRDVLMRALSQKPDNRTLAASSFDETRKRNEQLSIIGMKRLRTIVTSQQVSKDTSPSRENDILLNRLNDNFLDENFMENEREYVYKTWNHIKQNRLTNFTRSAKPSKVKKVQLSDFTKQEREWKRILERRKSKHIIRDVCLEYEYSPDYCFNSMIDVLSSLDLIKPIAALIEDTIPREKHEYKHQYRARIFQVPPDSLHSKHEFPFESVSRPARSKKFAKPVLVDRHREDDYLVTEAEAATDRGNAGITLRKPDSERHKMATGIDSLHRRRYLVLREGDLLRAKVEETKEVKVDCELARLHTMFGENSKTDSRVFRGRRQARRNAVCEQNMVDLLYEKYLNDFVEVDKAVIKVHKGDNLEFLYEGIRANELEANLITDLNWSGEQVMSRDNYPDYLTNRVISALNNQEVLIWVRTISGFIQLINYRLQKFCNSLLFELFMATCTIINVLVLIGDGIYSTEIYQIGMNINFALTFVYQAELLLKLQAFGIRWYLRSYVNILECVAAIGATVEISISSSDNSIDNNKNFLAAFRVLRLTRLLSKLRFMEVIHSVVLETFEHYFYVALLLVIFLFIFGLIGMQIFGGQLIYDDRLPRQNFDSLLSSLFSLFQLLTLENWTDIVEILYSSTVPNWVTLVYVFAWTIIGNYSIFNLFLALLLSGFDNVDILTSTREERDTYRQIQSDMVAKYQALHNERDELKKKVDNQDRDIQEIMDEGRNKNSIMSDEQYLAENDKQRKKDRAVFFPIRNTIDDESSLEFIFEQTLRDETIPPKNNRSIYNLDVLFNGVECELALGVLSKYNYHRRICAFIVTSKPFEVIVIVTIILSTLVLVVETYLDLKSPTSNSQFVFLIFEGFFLLVFILEASLKITRSGLVNERNTYLRDPWSWLELMIIVGTGKDLFSSEPARVFSNVA
jgi:hypothetical protein